MTKDDCGFTCRTDASCFLKCRCVLGGKYRSTLDGGAAAFNHCAVSICSSVLARAGEQPVLPVVKHELCRTAACNSVQVVLAERYLHKCWPVQTKQAASLAPLTSRDQPPLGRLLGPTPLALMMDACLSTVDGLVMTVDTATVPYKPVLSVTRYILAIMYTCTHGTCNTFTEREK